MLLAWLLGAAFLLVLSYLWACNRHFNTILRAQVTAEEVVVRLRQPGELRRAPSGFLLSSVRDDLVNADVCVESAQYVLKRLNGVSWFDAVTEELGLGTSARDDQGWGELYHELVYADRLLFSTHHKLGILGDRGVLETVMEPVEAGGSGDVWRIDNLLSGCVTPMSLASLTSRLELVRDQIGGLNSRLRGAVVAAS